MNEPTQKTRENAELLQRPLPFVTKRLPSKADYSAPDGSEIRLLPSMNGGGVCHCTLPAGSTSLAVAHQTVEEIWYVIEGKGEVWRKLGDQEEETSVKPGVGLTIPVGTHFRFRNIGEKPLCILITTMPPWPSDKEAGEKEAVHVPDHWAIA